MRKTIPILFSIPMLLVACQYVDKVPSKDELLAKELEAINWNEVDVFPSVSGCDTLPDKAVQRSCFFNYMSQEIQSRLGAESLPNEPQGDTIEVKVTVFPDSTLSFQPQFPKDSVAYDTIRIDSILRARLADFPKVSPALKRGIPVKSQFVLPVILKIK